MGLGLAVVQRNAEALGAKIIVKSEPPQGSSFVVIVPTRESPTEYTAPDDVPERNTEVQGLPLPKEA